jgi:hypothetical protein
VCRSLVTPPDFIPVAAVLLTVVDNFNCAPLTSSSFPPSVLFVCCVCVYLLLLPQTCGDSSLVIYAIHCSFFFSLFAGDSFCFFLLSSSSARDCVTQMQGLVAEAAHCCCG